MALKTHSKLSILIFEENGRLGLNYTIPTQQSIETLMQDNPKVPFQSTSK